MTIGTPAEAKARADLLAAAHAVPCPNCHARIGEPCASPGPIGAHYGRFGRGQAMDRIGRPAQHQRAVAARARLDRIRQDVASATACECDQCPSNVELAEWLDARGLLGQ